MFCRRLGTTGPALLIILLVACGESSTATIPVTVVVTPGRTLAVGVGEVTPFQATARNTSGQTLSGVIPTWSSSDPEVATVSAQGFATAVGVGTTLITASTDGAQGNATLEVWIPPEVGAYEVGVSYFGRAGYVEYIPGGLPLVISAPHGGALTPVDWVVLEEKVMKQIKSE